MPIDLASSCRYCHSTQGTNFLATERMLGLGGEFTYRSCSSCGSIQLSSIPKDLGPYYPSDVIMLHHSFEHMADSEQVMKTCFERLNPGGRLLVRCPVADAAVWKEKQSLWVQLDAPRHLTIPSTQGFIAVAQRNGFEVQEISFDSSAFQFWGTALYEQGEKLDRQKISSYFSKKQLEDWEQKAIQYNQEGVGDQACFFCIKPREKVGDRV
jgi:SAM-dependent methyltransferase